MSTLEDRYDVGQIIIRYATSVDQRDMARYGSCFADDVIVSGFSSGDVVGRDAWVAFVDKALGNFVGTHHQIRRSRWTVTLRTCAAMCRPPTRSPVTTSTC